MALSASNVSHGSVAIDGTTINNFQGTNYSFGKSPQHTKLHSPNQGNDFGQQSNGHALKSKLKFPKKVWHICAKPSEFLLSRGLSIIRRSSARNAETQECIRHRSDPDTSRAQGCHEVDEHPVMPERTMQSSQGLAEACQFVYNDARFVNERARNDIVLLSRGIMRLDARARQDVAIIGSGFLKLDARARKDTQKIDHDVKKKAERLNHIATILRDKAQSRLKSAADKHWSDGALEADLRRADFFAKQRAMEDALMALEFVKNIHDMMLSKMYKLKRCPQLGDGMEGCITIEKNGRTLDFFPGEVSADRITAIQEAYRSMASALSEADGIDYTDPEELELLIATLIDLDAMDGKSSVSLLAECSSSPDVNTRKALANALATAPSMWTLGNAGMGALQRLAEDSNPTIAAAASKAIYELKKQWEIEEGDSWRFMMNQKPTQVDDDDADAA
ncbi:senescence-associated protein AAF, chlorolplastic isoform X3 [Diospyros lotus]|uniref:senescence-associated protein AAF, chlorolplastic isoform X1 n=1 Tax=Diospyros lotus TaxID=55363 RepID=UPI00224D90A3|nr:senescence-associated protein AAF, chlorolplastic isoform X1 [Diospyros lotus]XP_052191577.1 senescence-associated protein AAF, chlorolplastic isoform X1 [Diospyros lotus]XP_052191578.1 senescence-associated protein AAF, chlorolplastic isoform X1 [Diospyros lotus]XP_052191579.1 senescence-associated protein AAF, chlorolplastic isoform X2 [Diospyros lotus]XP_052191580.1 senescence-associated protein AAF, chlorolplastic isoform X3 [Diospyros lotus]